VAGYSFYEVLNVPKDATQNQIQSAYRALLKQVHPDMGGTAGMLDFLQRVYEVLSDPAKRQEYDEQLARGEAAGANWTSRDDHTGSDDAADSHQESNWNSHEASMGYRWLTGIPFELFLADVFEKRGCKVSHRPPAALVDIAIRSLAGGLTVVSVTSSINRIPPRFLWEIDWARKRMNADAAMVITNSTFTPAAIRDSWSYQVHLWDCDRLAAFLSGVDEDAWSPCQVSPAGAKENQAEPHWSSQQYVRQESQTPQRAQSMTFIHSHPEATLLLVGLVGAAVFSKLPFLELAAWLLTIIALVLLFGRRRGRGRGRRRH
jgi:hypothetical protein